MKKRVLFLLPAFCAAFAGAQPSGTPGGYKSPYVFQFALPEAERTAGFDGPPWSTPEGWSILPRGDWYRRDAYQLRTRENLAYGARPIDFPASRPNATAQWKRERVLTVAGRLIGLRYQHHHLPNFDPYPTHPDWPWLDVRSGVRGPGMDCSNFVAWCYNFALGIRLSGAVVAAARETTVRGPGGRSLQVAVLPGSDGMAFADFVAARRAGDIIYIHGERGSGITHTVLWIGDKLAVDSNHKDQFFIIDSTGAGEIDSNGVAMPDGVQIRPFRAGSWYFRNAAFVHRVIED